jgi:hypothetical protein
MNAMRWTTLGGLALTAVLTALLAPNSHAECPTTLMWNCGSDAGIPSTLAGATFGGDGIVPWSLGQPVFGAGYDIVHGALEAEGSGDPYYGLGCGQGAWMVDDYWIDGPPSATGFTFDAVLLAEVTITGTSYANGGLIDFSAGPSEGFTAASSGPQTAVIHLTKSVGEVFQLETRLEATLPRAVGSTHATGTLRFRGLPVGYSVVSCHGYALPTPALNLTWGGVKAQYR